MWAQPRHLATPGLATWRLPGGDQKFLKWGGGRVASYISHPEVLGFFKGDDKKSSSGITL